MSFKKGQKVVQILSCAGVKTASVKWIRSVSKGVCRVVDGDGNESVLKYDAKTGEALENPVPGTHNEIVVLEH